jgi:nitroreductase
MEAARLAPSARNEQEWRFVLVTDPIKRTRIGEAADGQRFVGEAPMIIVGCADTDGRLMACGHPAFLIDVAIAMEHIALAAVEAGLGTCWIGAFDGPAVREIVGAPAGTEVVQIMPIGYPLDQRAGSTTRLPYDRIVRYDNWE